MLDRQHIGRQLETVTRRAEEGRLRFFLDVIGEREAAFAAATGERRLRVPPTYLFCLEMMDDPAPVRWLTDLGVDLLHILHGQQRFEYHAAAFAGDTLTFERSIADIYEKKGGALQFIVKQAQVRNQHGEPVATLSSTVVYRDPAAAGARSK